MALKARAADPAVQMSHDYQGVLADIATTDAAINQAVNGLYGLSAAEVALTAP